MFGRYGFACNTTWRLKIVVHFRANLQHFGGVGYIRGQWDCPTPGTPAGGCLWMICFLSKRHSGAWNDANERQSTLDITVGTYSRSFPWSGGWTESCRPLGGCPESGSQSDSDSALIWPRSVSPTPTLRLSDSPTSRLRLSDSDSDFPTPTKSPDPGAALSPTLRPKFNSQTLWWEPGGIPMETHNKSNRYPAVNGQ
eukprot:gene14100-biopygen5085